MTTAATDRFIRTHLKTRHLVLLVELGRLGSIAHAAKAVNLTQPAASRLLSELEYALGTPLFERQARGIKPNRYGEVMIRRAGAALAEIDAAHQEVTELATGSCGNVDIGTILSPYTNLIPSAITLLKSRHHGVTPTISVDTSKVLVNRLRAGELDLVIGRILDTEAATELHFEPIVEESHRLIVRAGHHLLQRPQLTLPELVNETWILPPRGSILRDRLTAMFLAQGLEQPSNTVQTMSVPIINELLLKSDMLVALPEEMVTPYLELGMLAVLPFELGIRLDFYGIITRKRHQLSPAAGAMLAALHDVIHMQANQSPTIRHAKLV